MFLVLSWFLGAVCSFAVFFMSCSFFRLVFPFDPFLVTCCVASCCFVIRVLSVDSPPP